MTSVLVHSINTLALDTLSLIRNRFFAIQHTPPGVFVMAATI